MSSGAVYSIDTSALLDGMKRHYPPSTFKGLWTEMETLAEARRLLASEEVYDEVKVHDDEVKAWIEARSSSLVVPTDGKIAAEVTAILAVHPKLVMNMRGRNRADPFVIAVAKLRGAIVVTGEGSDGTIDRPKIPFICQRLSIPCIKFLELIQAEGWTF